MTGSRPVAFVTGASGFVGRHLTLMLEGEGWTVRRALRTPTAAPNDFCIESIDSATNWKDGFVGADAVIHLAARVHH